MRNPIVNGTYADPESRVYGKTVYMYVTKSLPFEEQLNLDLVVSEDLECFTVHHDILDMSTYRGVTSAVWAPTVIDRDGKYYLIFAANNIFSEDEIGGLYLGVSDDPKGPFKNVFADGRPLLNRIFNRAQPIDAHIFKDEDGAIYLYYGGWSHMMVCKMNATMDGFDTFDGAEYDGIAKDITPLDYVEAPYVMKIGAKYHLMYSSGNWENGTYCVKSAEADSPLGPFTYYDTVLQASALADGPGHNSAFFKDGKWYVAYHRRNIGDNYCHNRYLCIDALPVADGYLQPIKMT